MQGFGLWLGFAASGLVLFLFRRLLRPPLRRLPDLGKDPIAFVVPHQPPACRVADQFLSIGQLEVADSGASRITLSRASATGLRSTFAMPGSASSSVEIWEAPSSEANLALLDSLLATTPRKFRWDSMGGNVPLPPEHVKNS